MRLAEARDLERRDDVALRDTDARDFIQRSVAREEARRQKELDDARRLAEAERLRAEEQTRSAAKLRRVLVVVGLLALSAVVLGTLAGALASNQIDNADIANHNAATAEAASALAVANASTAQAAESDALKQRDEAQHQSQIAFLRQLGAQSLRPVG